jgi:hypothetical protein
MPHVVLAMHQQDPVHALLPQLGLQSEDKNNMGVSRVSNECELSVMIW